MHRQARQKGGGSERDFTARTEFSVSFRSQCAYLWCIDGKGPQRKCSPQIIPSSRLQSLLKFTLVSYARTPLIILASEKKGKLVCPIGIKMVPVSPLRSVFRGSLLEHHCVLSGISAWEHSISQRCWHTNLSLAVNFSVNSMVSGSVEGSFVWS